MPHSLKPIIISFIICLWLGLTTQLSHAQMNDSYTVQAGDTLTLIALRYNLAMIDIALANQLPYPYLIYPGQTLILPGILPPTPTPIFTGYSASPLMQPPTNLTPATTGQVKLHTIQMGETLFSIATLYGVSMPDLMQANGLTNPDILQMGQILEIPSNLPAEPTTLPEPFSSIYFSEAVIMQGHTLVVKVNLSQVARLSGVFNGTRLFFTGSGQQKWVIVAVDAMTPPDSYAVQFTATMPDGRDMTTYRNITVTSGGYGTEDIQLEEGRETLLDPETSQAEWELLTKLWSQITPRPLWQGTFNYPVNMTTSGMTSFFGTRRSYNASPIVSFHSGVDFSGGASTPIFAPAAGRVVLADTLQVRGNVVLLDHGLGLFSGYWHQSRIMVEVGQEVEAGDLIGYVGDTGLVTGPHLHWEMRLNGLAVEPLQWTEQVIP